jgi:hypothetical protein
MIPWLLQKDTSTSGFNATTIEPLGLRTELGDRRW